MSKSDTFKLVLVVVGLVLVAIKLRAWLLRSEGRVGLRFAVAGILALACPVLIGTGMVVASTMGEQIEAFAQGFSKEKPQGSEQEAEIRFAAWREAIVRGSESGMLGLGPGPHLYIPVAILTGRRNTRVTFSGIKHPDDNGIPNFEAHNTLLDLFTELALTEFGTTRVDSVQLYESKLLPSGAQYTVLESVQLNL